MIRRLKETDVEQLKEIHRKFYADEFSLEDFYTGLNGIVVSDDNDRIITVGGTRPIMEAVVMTNKDTSVRERRFALYRMLQCLIFSTEKLGFEQLHAFIQDKDWERHLIKAGFRPTKGRALYIDV